MLFELRNSVPNVSSAWLEVRDHFLRGQVRRAWELATALRGTGSLQSPHDYLLNIELARACSANKTYMALVRRALAAFPEHPYVRLYHARVLLTRSRQIEGIEFLLRCEPSLGQTHRALWGTELANVYASAGFEESSRRWLDKLRDVPGMDAPLALYSQSGAREGLQQWEEATEFAQRCVAAAPDWTRARAYLANCLLARGRIEAAERELAEAARRGHEEALIDIAAAMLQMSLGRFDQARLRLESILRDWPQADFLNWVRRTLCILLVELGDYDAARQAAQGREERFALPPIPAAPAGRHDYIPLPLVAQNRNQCVPTSVAMAVYPQGKTFDPDTMYREMHGREGTPLWRMREWAETRGFRVVPIRLEKEAVVAMLDAQVPLIGVLEGPFNSHVDVVCGYNDDLQTLYVRDPGHWAPMAWPWELALQRYQLHAGLLAVIDATRLDVLAAAESWRADVAAAVLDLAQAVAQGHVEQAESAYARIPDDSPASFVRDTYGVNVAISPIRFRERMRAVSEDESAHAVARFRAVMSLGSDDAESVLARLLERDDSHQFSVRARLYLRLLKWMAQGNWPEARRAVERLLIRGSSVAHFWDLKSDILAELGEHDASREALERAIELEPLRMSTREKALNRTAHRLTLAEYLAEFDALLAEDPDDKRLLLGRAAVLQDGPDGKACEQACRDAIRWFPRYPAAHANLLNWYSLQSRDDLYQALLTESRRLLPEVFAEGQPQAPPDQDQTEADHPAAAAEPELPEDKGELLKLVWQMSDPRRDAALARARELQEAGQLHWYEAARLLACRLLFPDRAGQKLADPENLLPIQPPGAAHWFANLLCDVLTDYEPEIRTALAVDRWLNRVVPNVADYSELWFKRVLLLEHARRMEQALEELRKLLERYPATSSALYRMGVVKYRQQDYSAAQRYFERALEVNPGLYGAMDGLRKVHDTLGDRGKVLACTRMLRRKLPYSVAYLRDEVLAVADQQSLEAAEHLLQEAASDFPERRLAVLRARLYLTAERIDEAAALLAPLELSPDEDEDSFEECLQAKLQVALKYKDSAGVLALCEAGLRRWPNSTRLKEIQAEQLAESDPEQSRALLQQVLCEGEPGAETAWQYLQISESPADEAARALVLGAPEGRRQNLAELFSEVTSYAELLPHHEPYLTWALGEFPESELLRWRLASHYNISGRADRAVELAEELYRRNPDNPEAARMLGRCLIDLDAKRALPHLERVCEQNRAVDYLFDLARCHQNVGNPNRSQELYWEILEQNPYMPAAWTNLYVFGASRERLWPLVLPMLERGYGLGDEYFYVATVKIALELRRELPASWFPLALQRWAVLQTLRGYLDERPRLRRALLAWQACRPQDCNGHQNLPRGWWESLLARFWWPRCRWVARGQTTAS